MARKNEIEIRVIAKDLASNILSGIGNNFKKVSSTARTAFLAIGGFATALGGALFTFALEAAPLENIEKAFIGISEAVGVGSETMLMALEKASFGMISQTDLMAQFNRAASLVGNDFAVMLPDAMESLAKVSAATGEDLDFLLNSLVVGVGRMSPMILDNLGIQVDLNQAYEDYAKQIGKSVSELTKQEQQMALAAQVTQKLADSTAAIPDITNSASARIARFRANLANLRFEIGKKVLPVIVAMLGLLDIIAFRDFTGGIGIEEDDPLIRGLLAIHDLLMNIATGANVFKSVADFMFVFSDSLAASDRISTELNVKIFMLSRRLHELAEPLSSLLIWFFDIRDILATVGIMFAVAFGPVVLGTITALVGAMLPLILTTTAVFLAVKLLRTIFMENFDVIERVVTIALNIIIEKFNELKSSFSNLDVSNIIEKLSSSFSSLDISIKNVNLSKLTKDFSKLAGKGLDKLGEIFEMIGEIVTETVFPILEDLAKLVGKLLPKAIDIIIERWGLFFPITYIIFRVIKDVLLPVFMELFTWLANVLPSAIATLSEFFNNSILPTLQILSSIIISTVIPALFNIIKAIGDFKLALVDVFINILNNIVVPIIRDILVPILTGLLLFTIRNIIGWIEIFGSIFTAVFSVIQSVVFPILEVFAEWLGVNIPIAIQALTNFWNTNIQPILDDIAPLFEDTIVPAVKKFSDWLGTDAPTTADSFKAAWDEVIKPVFDEIVPVINDIVLPVLKLLVDDGLNRVGLAFVGIKLLWDFVLKPALETFKNFLNDTLKPVVVDMADNVIEGMRLALYNIHNMYTNTVAPTLDTFKKFIVDTLKPAIVDFTNNAINVLNLALLGIRTVWSLFVKPGLEALKNLLNDDLKPVITDMADNVIEGMRLALYNIHNMYTNTVEPTLGELKTFFEGGLKTAIDGITDSFGFIKDSVNDVIDAIDGLIKKFEEATSIIPSWALGASPPPLAYWFWDIATAMNDATGELNNFSRASKLTSGSFRGLQSNFLQPQGLFNRLPLPEERPIPRPVQEELNRFQEPGAGFFDDKPNITIQVGGTDDIEEAKRQGDWIVKAIRENGLDI